MEVSAFKISKLLEATAVLQETSRCLISFRNKIAFSKTKPLKELV